MAWGQLIHGFIEAMGRAVYGRCVPMNAACQQGLLISGSPALPFLWKGPFGLHKPLIPAVV